MPVKVKQINEYLFSDTVQSQKTKNGSDEISQGQVLLLLFIYLFSSQYCSKLRLRIDFG